MFVGKTLLAQVKEFVPWTSFTRIVDRLAGNSEATLACERSRAEQFRAMTFAQLTLRDSLRDIEGCLGAKYIQALRDGFSLAGQALPVGRRQRIARLAHLARSGHLADPARASTTRVSRSVSSWTTLCTRWTQAPSICV